ncbi:ATP-binding protein [Luteolibacter sp. GHJ8]|uniref:histidine kinase n=1 Tax=Luteolibacter rhizosphaerae TaxID=2989719 RepID=A0ABT3FYE1_9BACT|nr:ATP-binding protein [Luteolibacter rhizosphaerae]MCW1912600.1 ATP-binding protein [Luteolibacter rhizosphaerae]
MSSDSSSPQRPASEQFDFLIERIGALPLDEILRDLLRQSATTLGVERVGYWSMEGGARSIRRDLQYYLSTGSFDETPLRLESKTYPAYFGALNEGSNLVVSHDSMADPRLAEFRSAYFTPLGIASMLDAPVHRHGQLFGVVCHEHVGSVREWTAAEVDFARYVAQWIALAVEIDGRQRAEIALRESEARYRTVIEHSPTPTVVVDMGTGLFVEANESALRFYGVDRTSLLSGGPADFSPEHQPDGRPSAESAKEKIAMALSGEEPRFDWTHVHGDGHLIPCSVHLARMPGKRSERVVATVIDRTEQTRTEESMRRALEQERELGELRSRFTSIVSHEFRTPLGVIMSAVELLRNYFDRLDEERRSELFEDIHQATRRMGDLMEQVLVLGRADAGKLGFSPVPTDLAALCRKLKDEALSASGSKCPVTLSIEDDLSEAEVDEPLLRHIFSNLLSNAAKYSAPGSPVEFEVKREGPELFFRVADRGIGIPKKDQARLFEAFHRATNVGEIPGSGLGLLIAKRCIELHGGSIDFVSAEGEGTSVNVRLPLC